MLSLRVVFVALTVVCAAQAYAVDYNASPVETYAESGLYDKIMAMLEKARQRVKELDKELKDAVDVAYEKVQAAANKQAELWYQAIQKAVEQANEYGVDVSECISENHALKDIVHKMVKNSRKCIAAERPDIQKLLGEVDNVLEAHEDVMNNIKIAVEECKGLPLVDAVRCNVARLGTISADASRLLAYNGMLAAKITVQTLKSTHNITVCTSEVFLTQGKAAKQVVDRATQCIREKVQGHEQLALN